MDADFNLRYNFEQHLDNSNEDPPENDLEVLESLFAEEMTVEEVVLQDACASVSTRDAEREMQQTFSREREENFCAPQLKRFKIVSDEELQELKERRHSLSTLKATKWGVKTFQEWSLETYGEMLDFNNINPEELANKLGKFYAEATPKPDQKRSEKMKEQASEYHKNSFKSIRSALNRHIQNLGRDFDIVRDRQFKTCNSILDGKLKKNVQEGLARPTKHKEIIPEADLERISAYLYESLNPVSLRFRIWFILSMQFVSRGLEFHEQLKLNSLVFSSDENGCEYVTLSHATKEKNWQGGIDSTENSREIRMYSVPSAGDKCPVKSLRLYMSKIQHDATSLFNRCLKPALKDPNEHEFWYTNIPLKHYQFTRFMAEISKNAECTKTYTAHCLRATAIQGMSDAGFEIRHIMHMSGHKNEASVRSYSRDCSTAQKKSMSDALCSIMNPALKVHNAQPNRSDVPFATASNFNVPSLSSHSVLPSRIQLSADLQIESSVSMQCSQFQSSGFMANSTFNNCTFNFKP